MLAMQFFFRDDLIFAFFKFAFGPSREIRENKIVVKISDIKYFDDYDQKHKGPPVYLVEQLLTSINGLA